VPHAVSWYLGREDGLATNSGVCRTQRPVRRQLLLLLLLLLPQQRAPAENNLTIHSSPASFSRFITTLAAWRSG